MDYNQEALARHERHQGKLDTGCRMSLKNREDLSIAYTPGVAEPCRKIAKDPDEVYRYTCKGRMVAVVTDGTAVLGLGNIGPKAALPVMEGKAVLFKAFGGVDAVPLCLDTTDTEEFIKAVKYLAPAFGGINLEDISSPRCFEIERRLEEELDIPVFHDDQHGTGIVVTAALMNAVKVVGKTLQAVKVVLNGPGAAGTAIIKMLLAAGVKDITACDQYGVLHPQRDYGAEYHKKELCAVTNRQGLTGTLADALKGADVFIGVSVGGALTPEMVKSMAKDPIVFAMANPIPEIEYADAVAAGVRVMGTGRSDYPNQINNVLAFPGVFKGALAARARNIDYPMKIAAAKAIASLVSEQERKPEYIIPDPFDPRVAIAVAEAVEKAARSAGTAES